MSGTLAKGHECSWIVVHIIGIKAMRVIVLRIGKVVGIAMQTKERNQYACALFYGIVQVRYQKVLSALSIEKGQTRIFTDSFCLNREG